MPSPLHTFACHHPFFPGRIFAAAISSSSSTTALHAALYGAYLAGIGTFIYGFWRWTDPALLFGPGSVTATAAEWAYSAAVRG